MHLINLEILEIIGAPLHLPPFPCHILDAERLVPVVTELAMQRIGPVNRHRQDRYYKLNGFCDLLLNWWLVNGNYLPGGSSRHWSPERFAPKSPARKTTCQWNRAGGALGESTVKGHFKMGWQLPICDLMWRQLAGDSHPTASGENCGSTETLQNCGGQLWYSE